MKSNPIATITMMDGSEILLELYPLIAPITVANFADLANSKVYDGLVFQRIVKDFVIQGGSPDGTMDGELDFHIQGEFADAGIENDILHEPGVISMARDDGHDTAGTQFFIMHGTASRLDGKYAAFGKVISGFDVVEHMTELQVEGEWCHPLVPPVMCSVRVSDPDHLIGDIKRIPR